jgi:hypothetical protein
MNLQQLFCKHIFKLVNKEVIDEDVFKKQATELVPQHYEVWHKIAKHYECMKCKKAFITELHEIAALRNTPDGKNL